MTQEDKELLLKDLSARLLYGVICYCGYSAQLKLVCPDGDYCVIKNSPYTIETVKPYLRPMSSMTDEEKENLQSLHDIICDENYGDGYSPSAWGAITEWEDYCNSRHLDYRGLIGKGLALEAPEGMYKFD